MSTTHNYPQVTGMGNYPQVTGMGNRPRDFHKITPVSYTHLPLPPILRV